MTVLDIMVSSGADDGQWVPLTEAFNNTQSNWDAGYVSAANGPTNAFARFTGVPIGNSEPVDLAYVIRVCRTSRSNTSVNTIWSAVDADNAAAPTTYSEAESAARTSAAVSESNIPAWTANETYNSPELTTLIQELVDRGGWSSGNAVMLYWEDNGSSTTSNFTTRSAYSYNGSTSLAPTLHIEYTPSNTAPDITSGPDVTYASGSELTPANSPAEVDFTVTDAEETGAGEISWEIWTGSGSTGTQVTSGTATSGVPETAYIEWNDPGIVEGSQTLYLLVSDGTDTDEESFSLTVDLSQSISAALLTDAPTLHAATITPGEVTITAAHLASTLTLHTPATDAAVEVEAAHLASTLSLHTATLTAGEATLDAAHLDSTLSLHSATLTATATISAAHLDSTLALHNGVVTADGTIAAAHLASTLDLHTADIQTGAVESAAEHIASTLDLHTATVEATYTITAEHLDQTITLHTPDTVPGEVSITAAHIDSTLDLYPSTIIYDEGITAVHLGSTLQLHAATISTGAVSITAALLSSEVALYEAEILPGTVTLDAALLALTTQFHEPTVTPGVATLSAEHLASALEMYPATIRHNQTVAALLLDISPVLYPAAFRRVVPGELRLRNRTPQYRLMNRTVAYRLKNQTERYRLRKER